ncbi:Nif3-like dinuclear metal center hexameric protein [Halococcoides cellulosivorans]|uniref:Nif3-like dinuclear metal center hexameric protein n=1 Tax=Halococcoides cellulosivorans TaxID=1679096 RepID=A0A2R4WXY5_9EURY|nr:Nif3-like dinuclear metal center hexameric protein [Halococcoides cellulosivorans]AWB26396.1 Nif3-like dinuclear metal center hexameric protein [Halococcoides cellulosivorans]
MQLSTVCDRLAEPFDVAGYADLDPSANGCQVGPDGSFATSTDRPDPDVDRIAVAVDAASTTVETAVDRDADLLVVHHGIVWGGLDRVTGRTYDHVARLIEGGCALYAMHLPLDGHPELGNAARLADRLDLGNRAPITLDGTDLPVGQSGRLPAGRPLDAIAEDLSTDLDTGDGTVRTLDHGPDQVESVAIVTGAGGDYLGAAARAGADLLVTGEVSQPVYHEARERGLNVIAAGHYATETLGVRALADRMESWDLETTWIDHPTGL